MTDARSLVTTTTYYSGTALPYRVADSVTPTPNYITTIGYDTSGRQSWTQDAASKYTRFGYDTLKRVIQQWGDGAYPVSYAYDSTYGDRTGMSTYRSAPTADSTLWPAVGTADTTTWTFDTPSGLLWKKTDAAGKYVALDYDAAGRTSKRTLARGVYTTYAYYSATGELYTQTYSDGTPTVTYAYTRSGQADSVVDDTGTWDYVYDTSKPWRQASTTLPSFYGSRYWTALYESGGGTLLGRYLGFQLGSSVGSSADLEQAYTYSADGRFDTLVSKRSSNSVTRTFDYSYLTNTPFMSGYTIGSSSFSVTRGYVSNRNLLESVDSLWSATSIARYDYTYDARYQRATAKQSGTAFTDYYVTSGSTYNSVYNNYTYNARGEVETAAMYRGNTAGTVSTTPSSSDELPGRRFEYRFDSLGNRKNAGPTGDPNNIDEAYTTNALNQYTDKENNAVRFLGTATTAANVGVTGAPGGTGKKDHAWGADLIPANSSAVLATANVYAAVPGSGGSADLVRSTTKDYFIPKALQTFTYDDDGNLTADSVWDYTYDAENRLIAMQNRAEVIGSGKIASADARKLVFKYDYQGRRVRKVTYGGWNGTTYSSTVLVDKKYLYDGWNLIAEFDAISTLTLIKSYTWGLDLNGSLTSSGGVGALLQIYDSTVSKTLLSAYDGNGDVAALLNDSSGAIEAAYEYDPFGNLLRNEGSYASNNPFRFSTKYTDLETGLVYYGLRYHSPSMGRFINKDPIEEEGGLNLYGFCGNNSIGSWDYLGKEDGIDSRESQRDNDWWYGPPIQVNDSRTRPNEMSPEAEQSMAESSRIMLMEYTERISRTTNVEPGGNGILLVNRNTGQTLRIPLPGATDDELNAAADVALDTAANFDYDAKIAPNSTSGAVAGGSRLGNWLQGHVPLIGGILGRVADVGAGAFNVALGVGSFGQLGSGIGTGFQEIGGGVGGLAEIGVADALGGAIGLVGKGVITVTDVANILTLGKFGFPDRSTVGPNEQTPTGFTGALKRFASDLPIPGYGFMGGPNWGTTQFGNNGSYLNWIDYSSRQHDTDLIDRNWDRRNFSPTPSNQISPGPIGIAYALLGAIPFWIHNGPK